jgi:hypothetical protein
MDGPTEICEDDLFGVQGIPDFRFSLRFDDGPVRFQAGELAVSCPLCGSPLKRCFWRRLELFYEPAGATPEIVCESCARRHAVQLQAARDAYRRIVDPLDRLVRDAEADYVRRYLGEVEADEEAARRVAFRGAP